MRKFNLLFFMGEMTQSRTFAARWLASITRTSRGRHHAAPLKRAALFCIAEHGRTPRWLIGLLPILISGCAALSGDGRPPAPVENATITREAPASSAATPRTRSDNTAEKSNNCCREPNTVALKLDKSILNVESVEERRSPDAVFMALASLGIDYRWGGRSPATGFDCSGLVAYVYRNAFGMNLPTHTEAQSRMGTSVDLTQLETGDLVFYNTLGKPNTHVGIYIGENRFIHAPRSGATVRIENMRSPYWRARFSGARRLVT